jgi:hypothetical protein
MSHVDKVQTILIIVLFIAVGILGETKQKK